VVSKKTPNPAREARRILFCSLLVGCLLSSDARAHAVARAAEPQSGELRDGQQDFDFNFGVWKTHIRRLEDPLTKSRTRYDYDGTWVVSKVWGGLASLFELEATGPAGHIEGVGLRLYNRNRSSGV
jgi:hypothetical protein